MCLKHALVPRNAKFTPPARRERAVEHRLRPVLVVAETHEHPVASEQVGICGKVEVGPVRHIEAELLGEHDERVVVPEPISRAVGPVLVCEPVGPVERDDP
jgi:hypothetical protein